MQHEYPGKICALYGLRRTGKTVMMYQYISELSDKDKEKTVYILCLRECDMLELRQAMEDLYDKGVRNFFLDEITEVTDFQKYGNTSAASIGLAIGDALEEGRLKKGDLIALTGFGAGLTYGSLIMRWSK